MTDQAQSMDAFVALAVALADLARPIVKGQFRTGTPVSDKADASPVTEADRAAEAAMRAAGHDDLAMTGCLTVALEDARTHNEVCNAGLILNGHKDNSRGCSGPLSHQHQSRDGGLKAVRALAFIL